MPVKFNDIPVVNMFKSTNVSDTGPEENNNYTKKTEYLNSVFTATAHNG